MTAAARRNRYLLFLLLALAINWIDSIVTRSAMTPSRRLVIAAAASFDIVVLVTAIYYWLLVRPGIRGGWSLAPIALAGVLHVTYLYPNAGATRAAIGGLGEVGLIALVVVQVRRRMRRGPSARSDADPIDGIQAALAPMFMPLVANFLALEFGILYYALLSWRAKPHVPAGARAFTLHKQGGQADLLFAIAIACVIEVIPMHLLIHRWSPLGAWIATGVSLYGAIWLVGLARSIELRPALVYAGHFDLRFGLLFRLSIPREMVCAVCPIKDGDAATAVVVPKKSEPNLSVELTGPLDAERLFGRRQRVEHLAIAADDPAALTSALSIG